MIQGIVVTVRFVLYGCPLLKVVLITLTGCRFIRKESAHFNDVFTKWAPVELIESIGHSADVIMATMNGAIRHSARKSGEAPHLKMETGVGRAPDQVGRSSA